MCTHIYIYIYICIYIHKLWCTCVYTCMCSRIWRTKSPHKAKQRQTKSYTHLFIHIKSKILYIATSVFMFVHGGRSSIHPRAAQGFLHFKVRNSAEFNQQPNPHDTKPQLKRSEQTNIYIYIYDIRIYSHTTWTTWACVYVYVHTYKYLYMFIYIYIYIYIYI